MNAFGRAVQVPVGGVTLVLAFLASFFFWLVRFPYRGIEHDAVVYALLVARHLDPAAYTNELFFVFGSQDDFSLFTPLFGWLVSAFGLDVAARTLVIIGGGLWVAACLALSMIALKRHWLGLFASFLLASSLLNYSPNFSTFQVFEYFATARSVAFPLAVLAVAAAVAGRNIWFLLAGLLSTLMHPLLGIWALTLWVCVKLPERLTVIGLLAGFFAVLLGPFWSSLAPLQLMDPEWADVVRASSSDVFVGGWGVFRLSAVLFWLGLLWLGARYGEPGMRAWYLAMALVTAWAVLISLLCSQFWPIRLVMQAQPWRALWLAEALGVVALADLLRAAWVYQRSLFWVTLGLAAALWAFDAWQTPWPLMIGFALAFRPIAECGLSALEWSRAHPKLSLGAAIVLALVLVPNYWLALEIAGNSLPTVWGNDFAALRGFFLRGGEGVFFLALAWVLGAARWRLVVGLLFIPATAYAGLQWDLRSPPVRQIESQYLSVEHDPAWVESLRRYGYKKGDIVAWPGLSLEVWTILRTPYYATTQQATGIVFSRERAIEVRRRLARVSVAALLREEPTESAVSARLIEVREGLRSARHDPANLHKLGQGVPTEWGVKYLCTDPLLNWVIVPHPRVGEVVGSQFNPSGLLGGRQYLYNCNDVLISDA